MDRLPAQLESWWHRRPDYSIELVPSEYRVTVRHGDIVVADTRDAVVLVEQDHGDRLYVPAADVCWEHLERSEATSICPFKGEAGYWSVRGEPDLANSVWQYENPFPEVAGITGRVAFYDERFTVEVHEEWLERNDQTEAITRRFPSWGTAQDLVRLLDVAPTPDGRFEAPPHPTSRNVVEGGQLLGQAMVAAARQVPDQRVIHAAMTFPRAANFDEPIIIDVDVVHQGRSFSTVQTRSSQSGSARAAATMLLAIEAEPAIEHTAPMPDVGTPADAVPLDMGVVGRELRVVDGAYDPDPDRNGPPEIHSWCRFRRDPGAPELHAALLAQSTTHWTIAAAMRPHPGVGEAQAHRTLSTGIMAVGLDIHDDPDVCGWLLSSTRSLWSGRGLAHGISTVYSESGRLMATVAVQAMIRRFARPPEQMGLDDATAM